MSSFKVRNMPHVKATLKSENKIIYEDNNTLIIYNKKAELNIPSFL